MTAEPRFDRELTALLEELYLAPSPDYRHEVLTTAVRGRQRPSWTFPGRWLPMFDIATQPVLAPRVPWRAVGMVLVAIALLLAAAFIVGSRPPKLPAPFGPARNGLVAYSVYGDIYTGDAATGASTAIVTGPDLYSRPVFSRDGTRLALLRSSNTDDGYDLMVCRADGSDLRPVPGAPIEGMDKTHDFDFEWTADGQSLIVYTEPRILRLDAVGTEPPVVISADAVPTGRLGPAGLIPYHPASIAGNAVWTVGIGGEAPKQLVPSHAVAEGASSFSFARYSPDGSKLAFVQSVLPDQSHQLRIFVANADGTHVRRLTNVTGIGYETDFAWSPDGKQIAFNRWVPVDPGNLDGDWEAEPIGIAAVGGGTDGASVFSAGPSQGSQGAIFEWSPDGSALIAMPATPGQAVMLNKPTMIDQATGASRALDVTTNSPTSWQRIAP